MSRVARFQRLCFNFELRNPFVSYSLRFPEKVSLLTCTVRPITSEIKCHDWFNMHVQEIQGVVRWFFISLHHSTARIKVIERRIGGVVCSASLASDFFLFFSPIFCLRFLQLSMLLMQCLLRIIKTNCSEWTNKKSRRRRIRLAHISLVDSNKLCVYASVVFIFLYSCLQ